MNKIYRSCAALCLLLLLCGCGQGKPAETPAQPTQTEATQPRPGILSDAGQAETIQEYYSRTAIIARNERMEGSFVQTGSWAREYAALEYPGSTCEVSYLSGYVLPDAMTRDDLSGGVSLWQVDITKADGTALEEQVQVFYFTETGETGQTQCFSGLLTGAERIATRPEAYAYLALDTRFAARMQSLPDIEPPAGVRPVEFLEETGALDQQFYPLTDSVTAVLCRNSHLEDLGDRLLIYDREAQQVLESHPLEGQWDCTDVREGVLTLEQYFSMGEGRQVMTVTFDGGQTQLETRSLADDEQRVGDHVLSWRDGSIFLGEEALLQAVTEPEEGEEWDEISMETALYNFHQALDDHRFLYSKAGWEWIEHYGVYDLETREAHVLTGSAQSWDYEIIRVSADGSRAMAWCRESDVLEIVDLRNYTARKIPVSVASAEQISVNADLSRIALLQRVESNWHISVADTKDGAEHFAWELPQDLVAGFPELQLAGENLLQINLRPWKTDTEWLYYCRYEAVFS